MHKCKKTLPTFQMKAPPPPLLSPTTLLSSWHSHSCKGDLVFLVIHLGCTVMVIRNLVFCFFSFYSCMVVLISQLKYKDERWVSIAQWKIHLKYIYVRPNIHIHIYVCGYKYAICFAFKCHEYVEFKNNFSYNGISCTLLKIFLKIRGPKPSQEYATIF